MAVVINGTTGIDTIQDGTVSTAKIVADAVTTPKIADTVNLGRRNLVINGAMQVAQRGTSATVTTGTGPQTCDRFFVEASSSGTFNVTQSTTAPDGFANSFKFDCTSADASPSFLLFGYRIEGQDVQNLKKGTSGALSTTLSFYVRSSKTGTYQVNLRDIDNGRIIGVTYTISSANTWEYKTVTFIGDTSGILGNDNGNSLTIEWWLAAGSTYNSGAVPTTWESKVDGDRAAGMSVAIGASTDDDFYITGVQLEAGDTATPFEHRLYGEELSLCHRYYQDYTSNTGSGIYVNGTNEPSSEVLNARFLPVVMRSNPTVVSPTSTSGSVGGVGTDTRTLRYFTASGHTSGGFSVSFALNSEL